MPLLGAQELPPPTSIVKNYGGANEPERTAPLLCVLSSDMAKVPWEELGNIAAQMGFDGVDLTCYHGGHVEPNLISVDLIRAFEVIRGAGISVPVVTTMATNLNEPHQYGIIALSGNAEVRVYRTGFWKPGMNMMQRRGEVRRDILQLLMGGQQYKIAAAIPNKLGNFGESVMETQSVIGDLPGQLVGYYFDVAQAVAQVGPKGDWEASLRLALPRLKTVSVSDFTWEDDKMKPCPMGKGVVDWQKVFDILAKAKYLGPVSIAKDYTGGSEVAALAKDLEFTRKVAGKAYGADSRS